MEESDSIVVWDVETTELIDKGRRNSIPNMEISVACALIFKYDKDRHTSKTIDLNDKNIVRRETYWHNSRSDVSGKSSMSSISDLCTLLSKCKAHLAFNGVGFDMQVARQYFASTADYQDAAARLYDPFQDIVSSGLGYYSLNALLVQNGLSSKTASGSQAPKMWKEQRYEELEAYCASDVELLAQLITKTDSIAVPGIFGRLPLRIHELIFPANFKW